MRTQHLVFDLDDTLYPERAFAIGGFRAAAQMAAMRFGLSQQAGSALADTMTAWLDQGQLGQVFALALARIRPAYTPADLADFIQAYREHAPAITLFADAETALARYGADGTLGLITDGTHAVQKSKVAALGIARHFKAIVFTDALGGRAFFKPNPRAFEVVQEALGRPRDRFVYVGDNPAKDFVAPNAMGWTTIMIQRPGAPRIHSNATVHDGGTPQHVIPSLDALPVILR